MTKPRVLFLCTGNSARSQIAEAFLRRHGGDLFEVFSAGIDPKPINPFTYRVMAEKGFDLAGHSSKLVSDLAGKHEFDTLITVCDEADKNCPVGLVKAAHRMHWSFEDPAAFEGTDEERMGKFREVRELIENKIVTWVRSISDQI
jgi:arsenate reductase